MRPQDTPPHTPATRRAPHTAPSTPSTPHTPRLTPSSPTKPPGDFRPLACDTRYGYVVVICSFILQAISGGISFSVGGYYIEFLETFGESKGLTAWIGSINSGLLFGGGPIASILTNKFGHRPVVIAGSLMAAVGTFASAFANNVYTLYCTYGILAGLGFSFIYVPSVVVVGHYFTRRRNLFIALAVSGFGAGGLMFSPVLRLLIRTYGWRGAMIITSAICVQAVLFGALLLPVNHFLPKLHRQQFELFQSACIEKVSPLQTLFNVSLLKDLKFIIFLANNVLWNIGSLILVVVVADYALHQGVTKAHSSFLVSALCLSSLVGRLIIAFVVGFTACNRFVMFIISTFITGVMITLYPVSDSYWSLMALGVTYGLFFGVQLGLLAVITVELFGLERLSSAYGYLMFGNGTGALMGPPIAGWLYDYTLSYTISFYIGGGATILSAVILISIPYLQRYTTPSHKTHELIIETHYDTAGARTIIGSTTSIFSRNCYLSSVSVASKVTQKSTEKEAEVEVLMSEVNNNYMVRTEVHVDSV